MFSTSPTLLPPEDSGVSSIHIYTYNYSFLCYVFYIAHIVTSEGFWGFIILFT